MTRGARDRTERPPVPFPVALRRLLAAHGVGRGVTQKRAAELLGYSPSTITRWLRGQRQPPAPALTLAGIAALLADKLPIDNSARAAHAGRRGRE